MSEVKLRKCGYPLSGPPKGHACARKVQGFEGTRCWQHAGDESETPGKGRLLRKASLTITRGGKSITVESHSAVSHGLTVRELQTIVDRIARGQLCGYNCSVCEEGP